MANDRAPRGALAQLRADVERLGAKAAGAKWGASESWARRAANLDGRRGLTPRRFNFLSKHFEQSKQPPKPPTPPPPPPGGGGEPIVQPPEFVEGVQIVSKELAEHLRGKQPTAARAKPFYNKQDAVNYIKEIIGGSAVALVFQVKPGPYGWRYMVMTEKRAGQVDKWIDKYNSKKHRKPGTGKKKSEAPKQASRKAKAKASKPKAKAKAKPANRATSRKRENYK